MYDIPKEIKSKPKLFGLEIKELVMFMASFFLFFTMFREMVHSLFMIPYCLITGGIILWMFFSSQNNPRLKNYQSILFYLKRDQQTYHPLAVHQVANNRLIQEEEDEK